MERERQIKTAYRKGLTELYLPCHWDSYLTYSYYCICTVHVIRSLNCQYQHMHNFNVT